MTQRCLFKNAFPYKESLLALPVLDLNVAAKWYSEAFGMSEVERFNDPHPTVVLERDGIRLGFAINGGDAAQDGAAILVTDIHALRAQLESNGVKTGDVRIDERDGEKYEVFFIAAPDGLCYYFHHPIEQD